MIFDVMKIIFLEISKDNNNNIFSQREKKSLYKLNMCEKKKLI